MKFNLYQLTASATLTATLIASTMAGAQAQEIYVGAGFLGAQVGYAHAIDPKFNLRADFMGLGKRSQTSNASGTDYQSQLELGRIALLADWFPFESSGFRVSGGATLNKISFDLTANGAGNTVDINGTVYALGANDRLNIQVALPKTTPYLGIGWGHKPGNKGWGFHSDLGVSFGKFQVTETRQGDLVNGGRLGITQADMDKELIEVRNSVAKLKVWPQLTVGVTYSF